MPSECVIQHKPTHRDRERETARDREMDGHGGRTWAPALCRVRNGRLTDRAAASFAYDMTGRLFTSGLGFKRHCMSLALSLVFSNVASFPSHKSRRKADDDVRRLYT